MTKLIRITDQKFQAVTPRYNFTGNIMEVAKRMYMDGVELNEIEIGMTELVSKDLDIAIFGVNCTFMYAIEFDERN